MTDPQDDITASEGLNLDEMDAPEREGRGDQQIPRHPQQKSQHALSLARLRCADGVAEMQPGGSRELNPPSRRIRT